MNNNHLLQTLPPLNGELVSQDYWGNVVIRSIVQKSPAARLHFERKLLPGIKIGLPGTERAHSQGRITGHESAHGITYAPKEVNQYVQRLGIERYIAELFSVKDRYEKKGDNLMIILTTTTETHKEKKNGQLVDTKCLKEITYVLQVYHPKTKNYTTMFEASIEVGKPDNPRVSLSVNPHVSSRLSYSSNPFY